MAQHAILRFEKHKGNPARPLEAHHERQKEQMIVFGWFSVCGASYDYGDRDFLDFSTRAGKQFVWIICSFGLGFVLLMLDDSLYDLSLIHI